MPLAGEHLSPLWFFNRLSWILACVLISSTPVYGSVDPFSYTTSSTCLFGDDGANRHFVFSMESNGNHAANDGQSLLDPQDGMPFTKIDGQLRKTAEIILPLPSFHFIKSGVGQPRCLFRFLKYYLY